MFVKSGQEGCLVQHADLWGKRLSKYVGAANASLGTLKWQKLEPAEPDYMLVPYDLARARIYLGLYSIPEIFSPIGDPVPGFATQHDDFAVSFLGEEAIAKVHSFLESASESDARKKFTLCAQAQWNYQKAKAELSRLNLTLLQQQITYRPFDNRWTIWDRNVAVHRRLRVSGHLVAENTALIVAKNASAIGSKTYDGVSVGAKPVELNYFRRGGEYIFPIYLYDQSAAEPAAKTENLSPAFRTFLDAHYDHHYSPEEILGCIYAVLHAPTYRSKYAEFLRIDFPRIPFPEKSADFDALSKLGWDLVQAHLLKKLPRKGLADFKGKGDRIVLKPRYSPQEQSVFINPDQSFRPVPQEVWDFHIGGYQVLDKYLKSRKGRELSLDEITHVAAVADSLAFTIDQMGKIDAAYRAAFPDMD